MISKDQFLELKHLKSLGVPTCQRRVKNDAKTPVRK